MKSIEYLDSLRDAQSLKNDTALAEFLGLKQNTISQYRHGKAFMSNDVCLRVAAGLDMDNPLPIIMAADMDRAEKSGQHSLWEIFLPKMAGISAALVLGIVTNFVTPSPAHARPADIVQAGSLYYVKLNTQAAPCDSRNPDSRSTGTASTVSKLADQDVHRNRLTRPKL